MEITNIVSIVLLLFTVIGLFMTRNQIMQSRNVALGDFLLHLDEMFREHQETHLRLRPGGDWASGKGAPSSQEEWAALEAYMGLFERIYVLIELGILDPDIVKRLYGYRVGNILANQIIKQKKLIDQRDYWQDFNKLSGMLGYES